MGDQAYIEIGSDQDWLTLISIFHVVGIDILLMPCSDIGIEKDS